MISGLNKCDINSEYKCDISSKHKCDISGKQTCNAGHGIVFRGIKMLCVNNRMGLIYFVKTEKYKRKCPRG